MIHFVKKQHTQGFTLVEILVAIAIFMIVMVSTLGAFLSMVDLNKKVQAVRVAMDNANLAMEEMMREMRLGYDFEELGDGIRFRSQNGVDFFEYTITCPSDDVVNVSPNCFLSKKINSGNPLPITSNDIQIDPNSSFSVTGANPAGSPDTAQPIVSIFIKGKTALPFKDNLNFDFVFQSLATQRLYDK